MNKIFLAMYKTIKFTVQYSIYIKVIIIYKNILIDLA